MSTKYSDVLPQQKPHIDYFADNGFKINGIVHVGANVGQELPYYIEQLFLPIIAFEPHPIAFKILHDTYHRSVLCAPFALGSKSGQLVLNVPVDGNHERSSKFLPIETEGHDWTKIPVEEKVTVPVIRFDSWAKNHDNLIRIEAYDTLVIDVQGMELEVLKGFGRYLNNFHFLIVECSASPVYDGEASAQEVIDFLISRGFVKLTKIEEHDDIIFKRRGLWD